MSFNTPLIQSFTSPNQFVSDLRLPKTPSSTSLAIAKFPCSRYSNDRRSTCVDFNPVKRDGSFFFILFCSIQYVMTKTTSNLQVSFIKTLLEFQKDQGIPGKVWSMLARFNGESLCPSLSLAFPFVSSPLVLDSLSSLPGSTCQWGRWYNKGKDNL